MEGKKTKPRAILIFGAPCSGKTTFSEKFSKRFDLAYYNLDDIKEQSNLSRKNLVLLVKLVGRTGKTLVIEGGLATEREREEMRSALRAVGYEPSLVWIQTDVNTIRMRLKLKYRTVSRAKEVYDEVVGGMEAPTEFEKPIILSGKHTFETQCKHVLSGLAADVDK